jgi:hypothetical protein
LWANASRYFQLVACCAFGAVGLHEVIYLILKIFFKYLLYFLFTIGVFEKKENRDKYGDLFFGKIGQIINDKVNHFKFEKLNNHCGEYIILANMDDNQSANLKQISKNVLALTFALYDAIFEFINTLPDEGFKYACQRFISVSLFVDFGICTTSLMGLKKTNCNVFGLSNAITKQISSRNGINGKILFTENFTAKCPMINNLSFVRYRSFDLLSNNIKNIICYELVDIQNQQQEKRLKS